MYIYLEKNKLHSFKVTTEVNTVLVLINIYILIQHNVFQNYKTNKQKHFSSVKCRDLEKLTLWASLRIWKQSASERCLWAVTSALNQIVLAQMERAEDGKAENSPVLCSKLRKKSPMVRTNCWTCDDLKSKFILKRYNLNLSKICI